MNKTVVAIAAILTAGAVAMWAIGGQREDEASPIRGGQDSNGPLLVGTGIITGVNFPAGGAICRLVDRGRDAHGLRCAVESTAGSVYNINALRSGDLDLALVQSDWQGHAVNGTNSFKAPGPYEDLRALFSLHSEMFNVLVRRDSGIQQFADLKGKRVNIGGPGSGQRNMLDDLLAAYGWTLKDFAQVSELRIADQAGLVCDKKVDAAIFAAGHPNGAVQEALDTCDVTLIDVAGPEVGQLLTDNAQYATVLLPAGTYERLDGDVHSFGLKATLVTTAQLGDETAYQIVRAVFDNLDELRGMHPAFAALDPRDMPRSGNVAPLHPGAERYFREKGLLQD